MTEVSTMVKEAETFTVSATENKNVCSSRLQVLSVALSYVMSAFVLFSPVLTDITPEHHCLVSKQEQLDNYFSPNVTVHNRECEVVFKSNQTTHAPMDSVSAPCVQWKYDQTYGNTFVSEFNLVCENSWKKPLIQFVFLMGHTIGNIISGPITDRFGRKLVFSLSLLTSTIARGLLSFVNSYGAGAVLQFITGVGHTTHFFTGYILAQELARTQDRIMSALEVYMMFGAGYLLIVPSAYLTKDWRWIVRIPIIITAFYIPILWFIPESPKWNAEVRKAQNKTLNPKLGSDKELETIVESSSKMKKEQNAVTQSNRVRTSLLFRNSALRTRLLVLFFLWNVGYLGFFTFNFNSSNLYGSVYLNCVISALVDMASAVAMALLAKARGLRISNMVSLGLCGIIALATPIMHNINPLAGTIAAMVAKFFITTSINVTIQQTGELFPTLLRNTAMGVSATSARITSAFSPFLIYAGEIFNAGVPFYIMGIASLLGAILCILLPETLERALPNSLEDALALEQNRVSCTSCRSSHLNHSEESRIEVPASCQTELHGMYQK